MCYIFKQTPCSSLNWMDVTVWILVASLTKWKEDQMDCRTQRLATQEKLLVLELSFASESEDSEDAVVVSAVGSYCVALGTGLGMVVGLTIGL